MAEILDMTCGIRSIWFDKHNPHAIYFDKRDEEFNLYFGKGMTNRHKCEVRLGDVL